MHSAAASAAAAARAVEAEVQALRSARRAYQRSALQRDDLAASVVRTINQALKRDDASQASMLCPPIRPPSAGASCTSDAARRNWKRNLAADLQGLC
jgi:hypothetical protein